MKQLIFLSISTACIIGLLAINSCKKKNDSETPGVYVEITDTRDGNVYKTINVGNQTWFAENLNYQIPDSSLRNDEEGWCYDNAPANCTKYGRLYEWHQAMVACPPGWHLPSDQEWMELEIAIGMTPYLADDYGERQLLIGQKLKSTSGWNEEGFGNGNDSIGFAALPGGLHTFYMGADLFQGLGEYGKWWTSTDETTPESFVRRITHYYSYIYRVRENKNQAYSVRCVRD
jgi:uncharacterized protein (TIGR02145 family)